MRIILCALALTFTTSAAALAGEIKKDRWQCVFPDKDLQEVVEAPDEEAANGLCRDLWNKAKRAAKPQRGSKGGGGVEDDVFSRRQL